MRIILKSLISIPLFFSLLGLSFAQSEYLDDWIGTWNVRMLDDSIVTWEIDDTWGSDTGKSHIAYGIKNQGNEEFQIYFGEMFMKHYYIEISHEVTVYDLPMDFSQYTELVPTDDFNAFKAIPGKYPIEHGWKGEDEPEFEPEPGPCAASYLLGSDDPRLDILRQFRDEKLSRNNTGTKMISLYYNRSQYIIDICEVSPAAKLTFKIMIEALIPVVRLLI